MNKYFLCFLMVLLGIPSFAFQDPNQEEAILQDEDTSIPELIQNLDYCLIDDVQAKSEECYARFKQKNYYERVFLTATDEKGDTKKVLFIFTTKEALYNRKSANAIEEQFALKLIPPPIPSGPAPSFETVGEEKVYDFSEELPKYPGGIYQLRYDVLERFVLPDAITNGTSNGGLITTRFVVKKDGSIGDIKVVRSIPDCEECSENVIKAIKSLSKQFEPGLQNGKPVSVMYTLPLKVKPPEATY